MPKPGSRIACLIALLAGLPVFAEPQEASPLALLSEWAEGRRGTGLNPVKQALRTLWKEDRKGFLAYLGGRHDLLSGLAADTLSDQPDATAWILKEGLAHPSARIRAHAASLLGRMRVSEAAPQLGRLLEADPSEKVREQCAWALNRVGTDAEVEALSQAARSDASAQVQRMSVLALAWIGTRKAGDALLGGIRGNSEPEGTRQALRLLTGNSSVASSNDAAKRWWKDHAPGEGYVVGNAQEEVRYGRRPHGGKPHRQLYILDASGSIPHDFKKDYLQILRAVPEGCWFDVVVFGANGSEAWKGGLTESTPASRAEAVAWVSRFMGPGGTTPLAAGLRRAFRQYDVDEMLLYSDGAGNVGVSGDDLANYLGALNLYRRVRLEAHSPATMHPGMVRVVQESGGGVAGRGRR
jgi:hypothetical protein